MSEYPRNYEEEELIQGIQNTITIGGGIADYALGNGYTSSISTGAAFAFEGVEIASAARDEGVPGAIRETAGAAGGLAGAIAGAQAGLFAGTVTGGPAWGAIARVWTH